MRVSSWAASRACSVSASMRTRVVPANERLPAVSRLARHIMPSIARHRSVLVSAPKCSVAACARDGLPYACLDLWCYQEPWGLS